MNDVNNIHMYIYFNSVVNLKTETSLGVTLVKFECVYVL